MSPGNIYNRRTLLPCRRWGYSGLLLLTAVVCFAHSEAPPESAQSGSGSVQNQPGTPAKAQSVNSSLPAAQQATDASKQQPKRILGVMPNYRAVSAGAIPPPPTDVALVHDETQALPIVRPLHALLVDHAVEPQPESLFQRRQAASRRYLESGHNAARFGSRKPRPRTSVQLNRGIHAEAFLRRQEPAAIMRQPVLGEHGERAQKFFPPHRFKGLHSFILRLIGGDLDGFQARAIVGEAPASGKQAGIARLQNSAPSFGRPLHREYAARI